jgi:predicted DNA-binding transcriptional regulator AlpA
MTTRQRTAPSSSHRILRPAEAWRKAGLSRSTGYRLEAMGRFPRRIKLTAHASGYIEAEIDAWIQARVVERDQRGGV